MTLFWLRACSRAWLLSCAVYWVCHLQERARIKERQQQLRQGVPPYVCSLVHTYTPYTPAASRDGGRSPARAGAGEGVPGVPGVGADSRADLDVRALPVSAALVSSGATAQENQIDPPAHAAPHTPVAKSLTIESRGIGVGADTISGDGADTRSGDGCQLQRESSFAERLRFFQNLFPSGAGLQGRGHGPGTTRGGSIGLTHAGYAGSSFSPSSSHGLKVLDQSLNGGIAGGNLSLHHSPTGRHSCTNSQLLSSLPSPRPQGQAQPRPSPRTQSLCATLPASTLARGNELVSQIDAHGSESENANATLWRRPMHATPPATRPQTLAHGDIGANSFLGSGTVAPRLRSEQAARALHNRGAGSLRVRSALAEPAQPPDMHRRGLGLTLSNVPVVTLTPRFTSSDNSQRKGRGRDGASAPTVWFEEGRKGASSGQTITKVNIGMLL